MQTNLRRQTGFTLIEVLIVSPLIILLIGVTIGYISALTGDGLKTQQRNTLAYNTQDALDTIDQDITYALKFKTTTGTLPSPQGRSNSTAAFTNSTANTLIIESAATDTSTLNPSRELIYTGSGECSSANPLYTVFTVYFIDDSSLYKRTILPIKTACAVPYQVNSCSPSIMQQATPPANCKVEDEKLLDDVASMSVTYRTDNATTTAANAEDANNIIITLVATKTSAGEQLSYSGVLRSSRVNEFNNDGSEDPDVLVVNGAVDDSDPDTFTCSWDSIGNAASYDLTYRFNGTGAWINGPQATTETAFAIDVTARRTQSIECRVTANLQGGGSVTYAPITYTIPLWTNCELQNGWENYGGGHATAAFTKLPSGAVLLKGLVRYGLTDNYTPVCTLPEGYRPTTDLILDSTAKSGSATARIDVMTTGEVRLTGASAAWTNLSGLIFMPGTAGTTWIDLVGQNNWINHGAGHTPFKVTKDTLGRAYIQGLAKGGTVTANTTAFVLPTGYTMASSNGNIFLGMGPSTYQSGLALSGSSVLTRGTTSATYWGAVEMYYPSTFTQTWSTPSLQSSWVNYGGTTWGTAKYIKSSDNLVSLSGLIKGGTTTTGTTIFTLPVNYRPSETIICNAISNPDTYGRIDIMTDGKVIIREGVANNGFLSLAGCNFIAEQ